MSGHALASAQRRQRLDIQGLRMLAVVSVVVNHVFAWPIGGFVGVDVFFVISGFLITGLLLREHDRSGRISMTDFYRRRLKRLMPAALTVLFVTVAIAALVLPRTRAFETMLDGVFAAIFVANWRFAATGTDYFAAGQPPSALQHYWSLSVEEQFYVIWPLLIIAVLWISMKLSSTARTRGWLLFGTIALLSAASVLWAAYETEAASTVAYFSTLSRAWELGLGAMLAVAVHHVSWRPPQPVAVVLAYAGMIGIVASWFLIDPASGFPYPWAALPVIATAVVLFAGADRGPSYDAALLPLTNRVSAYLGDISYSLYLWHFPVAILTIAFMPRDTYGYAAAVLLAMLVLSALSYRYIEDPARKSPWLSKRWTWTRRRTAVVASTAAAALVLSALTFVQLSQPVEDPPPQDVAAPDCLGAAALFNDCELADLEGQIMPVLDRAQDDTTGQFRCWRRAGQEWPDCSGPQETDREVRVALIGDSHMAMYVSVLNQIADERGWHLDYYLGNGCQWTTAMDDYELCDDLHDVIERDVADAEAPYDIVITSAARWAVFGWDNPVEGYVEAWQPVIDSGARVIVIEDAPNFTDESLDCISRVTFDPREEDCSMTVQEAMDPADRQAEAAALSGADLLRTHDLFCTDDGCPAIIGGIVVYRDTVGHLTNTYVESMRPYIEQRLDEILNNG